MRINIKGMNLRVILGAYEWERQAPRDVTLNAWIDCDSAEAAASDRLDATLDYASLVETIVEQAEKTSFHLVEALVDFVLKIITAHPKVLSAEVEIEKPGVLRFAKSVSVTGKAKK